MDECVVSNANGRDMTNITLTVLSKFIMQWYGVYVFEPMQYICMHKVRS